MKISSRSRFFPLWRYWLVSIHELLHILIALLESYLVYLLLQGIYTDILSKFTFFGSMIYCPCKMSRRCFSLSYVSLLSNRSEILGSLSAPPANWLGCLYFIMELYRSIALWFDNEVKSPRF